MPLSVAAVNVWICLQVVSSVLINLIPHDKPLLSLVGKSSIAEKVRFGTCSRYFCSNNLFDFLLTNCIEFNFVHC